jgi:hypothetical protein
MSKRKIWTIGSMKSRFHFSFYFNLGQIVIQMTRLLHWITWMLCRHNVSKSMLILEIWTTNAPSKFRDPQICKLRVWDLDDTPGQVCSFKLLFYNNHYRIILKKITLSFVKLTKLHFAWQIIQRTNFAGMVVLEHVQIRGLMCRQKELSSSEF